jgi:hypothetical protein
MFARFHDSHSPKTIVITILADLLGGRAVGFPIKLEDVVLKTNIASQIQTK